MRSRSEDQWIHGLDPLVEARTSEYRLRRQWAIVDRHESFPHAWPSLSLNDRFALRYHPDTRVETSASPGGATLIGTAVSTASDTDLKGQLSAMGAATPAERNEFLRRLSGTYVLILPSPRRIWVYTDPAAMMQVFHRGARVASSPTLLGHLERDLELDAEYAFGGDNDWYPGTLTPFLGVSVLLANHRLEVTSGHSERFWPTVEMPPTDPETGTEALGELLRCTVERLVDVGPVLCSLTGGKDSRVNLAALRDAREKVQFFTIGGLEIAKCDSEAPAILSERFGLNHRSVGSVATPGWILDLYDEMTGGMALGGRRAVAGAAATIAGPNLIHLNGNLGALAKSFFWPSRDPSSVRLSTLTKEFSSRPPRIRAGVADWLASVPELPPTTVYNLMYLEQRGGRWMGIGETASSLFYDSFTPFSSREVFETICGLPTRTQYGGTLLVDLVRNLWPELLSVPYCRSRRNWSTFVPRTLKNRAKQALRR